jgi:hypothetical protein
MIRRGMWLAAGAVLGVAGYRRAARLARRRGRLAGLLTTWRAVRAGMAEYRAARRPQ